MDVTDFSFLFDLITEEEMKQFNNEKIKLRKTESYTRTFSKITKMFWFETEEEDEIWFQITNLFRKAPIFKYGDIRNKIRKIFKK
jgi:hypothetical protein